MHYINKAVTKKESIFYFRRIWAWKIQKKSSMYNYNRMGSLVLNRWVYMNMSFFSLFSYDSFITSIRIFWLDSDQTLNSQAWPTRKYVVISKENLFFDIGSKIKKWHYLNRSSYWGQPIFTFLNPLTPKIWLSILPSSCYTYPCK